MEPVAVLLVVTFLAMVFAAGVAIMRQKPPARTYVVRCPEDGSNASVTVSWNRSEQRHAVVACDHRRNGQACQEGCLAEVAEQAARAEPTRVMP